MSRIVMGFILLVSAPALADRLILNDGTSLEGRVKKQPDGGWVITASDGQSTTIAANRVAKVEITGSADAAAADKLASLKRAVEPLSNLDDIIQRFERFITVNSNTPAADEAAGELALWRDRKAKRLVKVGSAWMTQEARVQLLRMIDPQIAEARQMLREGRQREAEQVVGQVLVLDAQHIGALYLNGLILFQQEKLPAARKSFEAVNSLIADHAPTLNNLAVLSYRQNQIAPALNYFDQAMAAAPADRVIVDNVAEALNSLRDEHRRLPITKKLEKRFSEQDALLTDRMQKQGQFRWGATFVNKKQFDELLAAEKAIKEKIEQMQADFQAMSAQIDVLDRQIETTERELKRIEADSYFMDSNGNFIRRPLPSYYFDQQRELQAMVSNRARVQAQQKALKQQAQRVQQDLPVPKYTGVQKMIGEEGIPVEPDEGSMPAPSTQPG